jgi:hypothetical protein
MDERERREALITELLRSIDAAVCDRVLVYGSLPPAGRDLDLLVRPEEESGLVATLREGGFRPWGRSWVRFQGCSASVVELIPAAALRLEPAELSDLFAQGTPLPGAELVVEPAPHHALLILARRLAGATHLEPKHRERINRELERDPQAWQKAREAVTAWAAGNSLEKLSDLYSRVHRRPVTWRSMVRKPHRNHVVVVCSVDPARRRLHADALCATLDRLGIGAAVEDPCPLAPLGLPPTDRAIPPLQATWLAARAALRLWLPIWRRVGRGRVLIYETSVVDVAAALSLGLPMKRSSSFALLPLRAAPSTLCAFLLEQDAKSGRPLPEAEAYELAATRFALRRVPADARTDDACVEIAEAVFDALSR